MKILIAPDKFKDALPALEVGRAIQEGVKINNPAAEITVFPMADGGEGTSDILTFHFGGRKVELLVSDPLWRKVKAEYGISSDGSHAFIEMAQASGLHLLKPHERNCLHTTTFGTGELIRDAISKGVQKIVLGIGGSATNDAGIGMAAALGYRFLDASGNMLNPVGKNLLEIATIIDEDVLFNSDKLEILVACDVENRLYGSEGAAYVFGPQKGADEKAVELLDKGLQNFASVAKSKYHIDVQTIKGAGAAGGMGAGCLLFLKGKLRPGVALVMALTEFEKQVAQADLVITGEGKLDNQTLSGKL